MADVARPQELPFLLRGILGARFARTARGRRLATALASRLLHEDRHYRTPLGFAIRVDPNDSMFQPAMALGIFEPHVVAAINDRAQPGTVAVDAGAHIGYFTLLLATRMGPHGHVEAFECDPRLTPRLREHVAVNGLLDRVTINERAVWSEDRPELELKLAEMPGWSYLGSGMWDPVGSAKVEAVSLDAHLSRRGMAAEAVSLIKLDVEGAEPEALSGMQATLADGTATVIMEFQDWAMSAEPGRREAIVETMAGHGYQPFMPAVGRGQQLVLTPGVARSQGEDVVFVKS